MPALPMSMVLQVMAHILNNKHSDLMLTPLGQAYEPRLKHKLGQIDALPAAFRSEPFADEMLETDDLYDAFHEAIENYADGMLLCPLISDDDKAFLKNIKATYAASPSERGARYAEEAESARQRRAQLPADEAKLKAWTVAPGHTLYDLVDGMIQAGEQLHILLGQRADSNAKTRKDALRLRGEALGMLQDLRRGIRSLVRDDLSLPRDLEARLFAQMDSLKAMFKSKPEKKGEPAPEGSSEPPAAP